MKRRCVVTPMSNQKPVNASKYDGIKISAVKALKNKLQAAFDYLEMLDDDTYQAVQGDSMMNDLDNSIRECQHVINTINGGY